MELESSKDSSKSSDTEIKVASAPVLPLKTGVALKPQVSAPSYFHSLKDEAAPFLRPEKEPTPTLIIGTIVNENEVVQMIAAAEGDRKQGLKRYLGDLLVDKRIVLNYNLLEKKFLVSLLSETIEYAAQRDFKELKLACLLTIYISTHLYFKWFYYHRPAAVWNYFKEIMVRHTIEDSPDGQEVFEPEECYDIMSHFHTMYINNLPLVHILTFSTNRLRLSWPFKPKA